MKIAIAGSSGLIGKALCAALENDNHQVLRLVRSKEACGSQAIAWDPQTGQLERRALEGLDAIVNLAGENIFGRWTLAKKKRIVNSRKKSSELLVNTILALQSPPKVFLNASATGFYGARFDEVAFEPSTPSVHFLGNTCTQWEHAVQPLIDSQVRFALLRFGAVLSAKGGALKSMLTPFKLGLGGNLGSGEQYFSWIAIQDAVNAILFILQTEQCQGAFNMVAPNPVTNAELTKTLGKLLHRPTFLTLPTCMVKLIFGELAEDLLLNSAKLSPQKLLNAGYQFLYPQLKEALKANL